jgi:broad specificity phosphatase PhoE
MLMFTMASSEEMDKANVALPAIDDNTEAFSHLPEYGISLFLANRTKKIHFVRHAEGTHNQASKEFGDDTPTIFSTEGSWKYLDARLTDHGIQQCVTARTTLLHGVKPQLVIVSPFTRTLQTAHIMFGGKGYPFMVHDGCRERWGYYTCDKRRTKTEIVKDFAPIYEATNDSIDFDSFGYPTENDEDWQETREPDDDCTNRGIRMLQFLATRPETEIAVVTHSSWLKHLFRAFGEAIDQKDKQHLHRLAGNAEVRSICLAMHKGFYPEGEWQGDTFVPTNKTFRRFRYAPNNDAIAAIHKDLGKQLDEKNADE